MEKAFLASDARQKGKVVEVSCLSAVVPDEVAVEALKVQEVLELL